MKTQQSRFKDPSILRRCLDDLASRIDEAQEERLRAEWEAFLYDRCPDDIFVPSPREPAPPKAEWPSKVLVNESLHDTEAMLMQQFQKISVEVGGGSNVQLGVRCNYGTCIVPSFFGAEIFYMQDEQNTLPTNHPMGEQAVRKLVKAGIPDPNAGWQERIFETTHRMMEIFKEYPILARNIDFFHPDTQGPIDIVELIWGSDMFLGFGDEPQLMNDCLELVTRTCVDFLRRWYALAPSKRDWSVHWGLGYKGRIALRNDSLMNLSGETYVEFIRPWDQMMLDEFDGGIIHYCGRGEHFIEPMCELRGLHAVHLGQPHLNDMETIYRHTIDRGIKLHAGLNTLRTTGRPMRGQAQG